MIPNIIHFIHLKGRPFAYLHYLVVAIAQRVNEPLAIFLWYDELITTSEEGADWWQKTVALPGVVPKKLANDYKVWQGISLAAPTNRSDPIRLEMLYEHGGIYLDLDVVCFKSFKPLLDTDRFLIGEEQKDGSTFSSAVLMAPPRSAFVRRWLDDLPKRWRFDSWAWHAVVLPVELCKEVSPTWFTVLSYLDLIPFTHHDNFFLKPPESSKDDLRDLYPQSYCCHLFETYWKNTLCYFTPGSLETPNTVLDKTMRHMTDTYQIPR